MDEREDYSPRPLARPTWYRHGETGTPLYHVWSGMRTAVGRRGTAPSVAYDWADFGTFRQWALTSGYEEGMRLRRRDRRKGFTPDNCYWMWPPVLAKTQGKPAREPPRVEPPREDPADRWVREVRDAFAVLETLWGRTEAADPGDPPQVGGLADELRALLDLARDVGLSGGRLRP